MHDLTELCARRRTLMKKFLSIVALTAVAAAPLLAQAPAGWKLRADKSTSAADPDAPGPIKFMAMGGGFHAINPQAAVYWNPSNTATGAYTVKGTFELLKPSSHTNYYGLVFGGSELEGANQNYLYFVVAQDGTFLVKHRANDTTTHDVVAKTKHAAIKVPEGPAGKSTNALEVRVGADKIDYVINGTVVTSTPKTGMTAKTDGIFGLRVNHALEVHISNFAKS
jgi:hypothetical protein